MQIINDIQLDYNDVLIVPQTTTINHRGEVEVERHFKQLESDLGMGYIREFKCCPVMNANMTQTGTFEIATQLRLHNMITCIHKFYTAKEINKYFENDDLEGVTFFITVGIRNKQEEIQKLKDCKDHMWSILIDVPNAYIPNVENYVKELRQEFPDRIIAVGNVCTGDRTQELIKAGANIVKVGIGPSQVCRTRHTTGCGRPQLSAVIECANAAHQVGGLIIADGGFNNVGDLCKAFVAGADICMSGCMFAGCDEAAGDIIIKTYKTDEVEVITCDALDENLNPIDNNYDEHDINETKPIYEIKKFKAYYGMSSFRAMTENYGEKTKTGTSEGVENKLIPYTGPVYDTINRIKGGLRSCGSYIGAKNIKNFSRQGSFYRVNRIQ